MTEAIEGHLLGFHILLDCKLNFTKEDIHKDNVDENISCTQVETIFDTDYLERLAFFTYLFDLLENSNDLGFTRLNFASEQISNFESDQVNIHILNIFLVSFVILLKFFWDLKQNVYNLVEIREQS